MTTSAVDLDLFGRPVSLDVSDSGAGGGAANSAEVVISLVFRNDKVLLIRRNIPGLRSNWMFPAGKIEPGETIYDTAAREVLEETGVFCRPLKHISRRRHPVTKKIVVYVACEFVSKAKDHRNEFRVRWFSGRNVFKMMDGQIAPSVRGVVDIIKDGRGSSSLGKRRVGRQDISSVDPERLF